MSGRLALDQEVAQWREDGWVVLDTLVGADEIDGAMDDLHLMFPPAEKYFADPDKYIPPGKTTAELRRGYPAFPEAGPAWRPEQHRWGREFPFYFTGQLNRLCVHPSIVNFAERALGTTDIRLYQTGASAKYAGASNYEQPMHTDRNHSLLPANPNEAWHVETFLYLSDVDADLMPTRMVNRADAEGWDTNRAYMPDEAPELYAAEHATIGPRGSLLAYRNDTFHRAVDMERPDGARFLLNVSFKRADVEWIGYHLPQSHAGDPAWTQFVEESTPRELALFGFPPPGHEVWTAAMLDLTQERYPNLDLAPWRAAR
jgi:hypothetical protein